MDINQTTLNLAIISQYCIIRNIISRFRSNLEDVINNPDLTRYINEATEKTIQEFGLRGLILRPLTEVESTDISKFKVKKDIYTEVNTFLLKNTKDVDIQTFKDIFRIIADRDFEETLDIPPTICRIGMTYKDKTVTMIYELNTAETKSIIAIDDMDNKHILDLNSIKINNELTYIKVINTESYICVKNLDII